MTTKVEKRWCWLARQIWDDTLTGWSSPRRATKADMLIIQRRVNAGHVEVDEYGLYRLTDAGRAAIHALTPQREGVRWMSKQ